MTVLKRTQVRGLNLRSSSINMDKNFASDVKNVELNSRRELVKRYGMDLVTSSSDSVELTEYKRTGQLIKQSEGGMSKLVDGSYVDISRSTSVIDLFLVAGSYAEYNGVLYWSDPNGLNELYKYDGYTFYRAGVPAPDVTTASGAGAFFYRIYLRFTDCQGNITSGDYVQFDSLIDSAIFKVEQMGEGFYDKFGSPTATDTIDLTNLNIPMAAHNYTRGDYIYMSRASDGSLRDPLRIASAAPGTITIDKTTLVDGQVYPYTIALPLESKRTEIVLAKSDNATFGYEVTDTSKLLGANGLFVNVTGTGGYPTPSRFLEDDYDSTILKGLPPKVRYIDFYNNVLIGVNSPVVTFDNDASTSDQESSIYWSDTGVGSTVETFPPFNKDTVGKSSEGSITGISALSDNVVIGKERQIYYINGNLILGTYRIRSALTNGIGCISHRSMFNIEGGCSFMSSRGVYLAKYGMKPIEMSDIIEPLFRGLSGLENAKAINDIDNEKMLIHIDGLVIVYDYYYKEWFLHYGIDGSNGIAFLGGDLYNNSSESLFKRSTSYNDNGVAIDAYYRTAWEDLGESAIVKKFKKVVLITSDVLSWTANIKTYNDWSTSSVVTDKNVDLVCPTAEDVSLDMTQTKSISIEIGNNEIDQGILVSGYEIDAEFTQLRAKGES